MGRSADHGKVQNIFFTVSWKKTFWNRRHVYCFTFGNSVTLKTQNDKTKYKTHAFITDQTTQLIAVLLYSQDNE